MNLNKKELKLCDVIQSSPNRLKAEIYLVKQLGEAIGYGHMMELASALWRQSLEEKGIPAQGAFIATLPDHLENRVVVNWKELEIYDEIIKNNL